MQQGKKPKIIKSFSQIQNISRSELYRNGKLKPLDKKLAVSIARELAEGFDVDLHKTPSKYMYQKARRVIDTWFSATNSGKYKVVRPTKKNRAAYSKFADMPKDFKIYAMPILQKNDEFRIKKGKVIRKGKGVNTEDYLFEDFGIEISDVILDPIPEVEKITKKIEKDYPNEKEIEVHIKVGRHQTIAKYDTQKAAEVIEKYTNVYSHFGDFVKGLTVFSFKGKIVPRPSRTKYKKNYKGK